MEGDKESNLMELKTELATVVEALNVLQDFIESVFGTKYQSFVSSNLSERGGSDSNIQLALRKLRLKNSRRGNEEVRRLSTQSGGDTGKDVKDSSNRETSIGGTPGAATSLSEEGRRDSSSSKVYSPAGKAESEFKEENDSYRFSLSVGRPEVVAVKCELEDTDFLDDMDPFGSEQGDYHYEGDESEIKIENCYPMSSNHLSEQDAHSIYQEASPITSSEHHSNIQTNSSPRFIPELIPIQSDPLLQNTHPASTSSAIKVEEDDSDSLSSENSDAEWHPTASPGRTSSQKSKAEKRKVSAKRSIQPERKSIPNFPPNLIETSPRQQSSSLPFGGYNGGGGSNGGPFKCDMCPASYKQEESLRSHQKYKHNPSRVQCICNLCGKSMVDKYRLQRHLRLHTGEKPFECEYCGQSFYRKDYHTKHLQRKHGIAYNAGTGNPSRVVRKPAVGKQKLSSSSPSSFTISPSSSTSTSSSSYQSLRSGVFETPSPPPPTPATCNRKALSTSSLAGENSNRQNYFSTTTSPTSTSTGSVPSSTVSSREMGMRNEQGSYIDVFSNHSGGGNRGGDGFGGPANVNEYFSNSGAIGNLMTMTSLTFDDLISADL